MRKAGLLFLILIFILGLFSSGGMAEENGNSGSVSDSVIVSVTVEEFFDVWFDTPDEYRGLFGQNDPNYMFSINQPGIYINDGQSTVNSVLDSWWKQAIGPLNPSLQPEVLNVYNEEDGAPHQLVELFKVDANTDVEVILTANWEGWMNTPTLFRVSSDAEDINGIGDWSEDLAVISNQVNQVENEDYHQIINTHNSLDRESDSFFLNFASEDLICQGPFEFHLNAALWLLKISQVAAGDYQVEAVVTVMAVNGADPE